MKIRSTIQKMTPYVAGERRPGAIKLASNENPLGPSPLAMKAAADAIQEMHIYPDGALTELRQAIATARNVTPDMVLPGNGSDEVLTMIGGAFFNPGDRVLIGAHTFSQYAFAARLFDARIQTVSMPDLRLTPRAILDAARTGDPARTSGPGAPVNPVKAIFICTPNNPTGLAFTMDELVEVLDGVPADTLVVVDHAYQEYAARTGTTAVADASRLINRYPNLIALHTFSKIYGLAANRVGYGLAAPQLITDINRVRLPFNVNSVGQTAAIAALNDTDFVHKSLEVNAAGKKRMQRLLTELGFTWLPTEANFICLDARMDAQKAADIVAQHGVTVRALTSFGLPRHLRITIGTDSQIDILEQGLQALAERAPVVR